MDRSAADLPPSDPPGIELRELMSKDDRQQYRDTLRRYGIGEKSIEKLKTLDDLAKNTGKLLAASLQHTHQNYIGQLHMLSEVCDELRETLKTTKDPETLSYLYKCYTEMVKEQGRGYELMMHGTENMMKMMMLGKGVDPDKKGGGKKPSWGAPKKVTNV